MKRCIWEPAPHDCARIKARGLCSKHWQQARYLGLEDLYPTKPLGHAADCHPFCLCETKVIGRAYGQRICGVCQLPFVQDYMTSLPDMTDLDPIKFCTICGRSRTDHEPWCLVTN